MTIRRSPSWTKFDTKSLSALDTNEFVPFATNDLDFEDFAVGNFVFAVDIDDAVDFRGVRLGAAGISLGVVVPAVIDDVYSLADHGLAAGMGERGLHFHEAV